ncbi:MAG: molybdenum cofactor guanylyltransferase [Chloroflexota bacterium]
MTVNGIVLAGGQGLRLGRNKVLETVGNRRLLQRVVAGLSFLESDIIVVTATAQSYSQLIDYPRLKSVTDIYPGRGPLGGIYTGLVASDSRYNLVVAGDMPFLNQALLRHMIRAAEGFDLVTIRLGKLVEPLHAVYARDCLPAIEGMLEAGELSVNKLFDRVRVRYVETEEIDRFDPEHLSFFNINTAADLTRASGIARKETENDQR